MKVGDLLGEDLASNPKLWADIYPIDPHEVTVRRMPAPLAAMLGRAVSAMTILQTVWVAGAALTGQADDFRRLLVHELVHARQWRALGAVGFLRRYVSEYATGRLGGGSHREAYHLISLEVEARAIADSVS